MERSLFAWSFKQDSNLRPPEHNLLYCRCTIGLFRVREVGLEPTKSKDSGFTVRPRCRWSTPDCCCFRWIRTFETLPSASFQDWCNQPTLPNLLLVTRERFELPTPTFVASCSDPTELTSLICGSKRIRTSGTCRFNTLAMCRFRPLSHTS